MRKVRKLIARLAVLAWPLPPRRFQVGYAI